MAEETNSWWPAHVTATSMIVRYELAAAWSGGHKGALLRVEATHPNDFDQEKGTLGLQFFLDPSRCREIAQHLLDAADLLDGDHGALN